MKTTQTKQTFSQASHSIGTLASVLMYPISHALQDLSAGDKRKYDMTCVDDLVQVTKGSVTLGVFSLETFPPHYRSIKVVVHWLVS